MANKTFLQTVKFTLFSISAGIIQIAAYTLLFEVIGLEHWISNIIAIVLSVVWNFTLNRKYTFKSAANIPVAMAKIAAFYLVFTPLSSYLGQLAVAAGTEGLLVEGLTMLANFVLEFLFCKFVVYRNNEDTLNKK